MNGPQVSEREGDYMATKLSNIRRNIGDFILRIEDAGNDAEKAATAIEKIVNDPSVQKEAKEAATNALATIEALRQALEDLR